MNSSLFGLIAGSRRRTGGGGGGGGGLLTSLAAYYPAHEAGFTDLLDATAAHLDFTQNGGGIDAGAGIIAGSRGPYYTSLHYRTSVDALRFGNQPFSISTWLNPATLNMNFYPKVMGIWNDGGTGEEWEIYWADDVKTWKFEISSSGTASNASVTAAVTPVINTWYHLGICWDGTTIKISVNGGAFVTAAFAGPVFSGSNQMSFGYRESGSGIGFQGNICETGFWVGRALSLSEFQTLYNAGAGKAFETFT